MLKTIIGFLSRPQFWTGLVAILLTFGIAGPAVGFISANAAQLAALFAILATLFGFGASYVQEAATNKLRTAYNDYTRNVELEMLRAGVKVETVQAILDEVE